MALFFKFINNNISNVVTKTNFLQRSFRPPINSNHFSKLTSIRRRLGIPEPPKKPMNAFMRFVKEIKPSIDTSDKSSRHIIKLAAERWRELSETEKQVYYKGYDKELAAYKEGMEMYKKNLGEDQLEALEKEQRLSELKRVESIEKRNEIKLLHDLGKPKMPISGYSLFVAEYFKRGENIASIAMKWSSLSESEKEKYNERVNQLRNDYKRKLIKWEAKMVAQGRGHLVRKNCLSKREVIPKISTKTGNE